MLKKHKLQLLLLLILGVFGSRALIHPGLFTAHDIWHQVARLYWYFESVKSGVFPTWVSPLANGFGYPLFLFSYSLPWIVSLPMLLLGVSVIDTIKAVFITTFILSGFSMYWFSFVVSKKKLASFVTATIYMFAPYHFLQMLVSAAIGRMFVFVFVPILFLGLYYLGDKKEKGSGYLLFSISFLCLSLSHLISFVAFVPALFLFALWVKPKFLDLLKVGVLSLGLSAFYVIPAVFYSGYTEARTGPFSYLYKNGFINIKQLLYSPWGFGTVVHDAREGAISYQLGFAGWFSLALLLVLLFKIKGRDRKLSLVLILTSIISAFLTLIYSKPLWDMITKVVSLDYPTMFIVPLVFVTSLAALVVIYSTKNKFIAICISFFLLLLCFINTRNYMRVNMYTDFPLQSYVDSEITTSSFGEYFPSGFNQKVLNTPKDAVVFEDHTKTSNLDYKIDSLNFSLENGQSQDITFRHLAFPGVSLYVNGEKREYSKSKDRLITIYLEKGEYFIEIKYERAPVQKVSMLVSVLSLLYLLSFLRRKKGK